MLLHCLAETKRHVAAMDQFGAEAALHRHLARQNHRYKIKPTRYRMSQITSVPAVGSVQAPATPHLQFSDELDKKGISVFLAMTATPSGGLSTAVPRPGCQQGRSDTLHPSTTNLES